MFCVKFRKNQKNMKLILDVFTHSFELQNLKMNYSKTIFLTYCSAKKNHQSDLIQAVNRYQSMRINQVNFAAQSLNIDFFILSGKFGIISSKKLIPDYDFMLENEKIDEHLIKVESQLDFLRIEQIIFFMRPILEDKNIKPYLEVIKQACKNKNINLTVVNLP